MGAFSNRVYVVWYLQHKDSIRDCIDRGTFIKHKVLSQENLEIVVLLSDLRSSYNNNITLVAI